MAFMWWPNVGNHSLFHLYNYCCSSVKMTMTKREAFANNSVAISTEYALGFSSQAKPKILWYFATQLVYRLDWIYQRSSIIRKVIIKLFIWIWLVAKYQSIFCFSFKPMHKSNSFSFRRNQWFETEAGHTLILCNSTSWNK